MKIETDVALIPSTARIRVLFADPDEFLLVIYREFLRDDFEVFTARDGVECLARLRDCTPDVLVLEPNLPWGGDDHVLALKQESIELARIPVMILTSCREQSRLEEIAPFRISDYCAKPLSPDRLAARIRFVLQHDQASQASVDEGATSLGMPKRAAAFAIF